MESDASVNSAADNVNMTVRRDQGKSLWIALLSLKNPAFPFRVSASTISPAIPENRTGALHSGTFCSKARSIVGSTQPSHHLLLLAPGPGS